jgi:hypothetical protein
MTNGGEIRKQNNITNVDKEELSRFCKNNSGEETTNTRSR